MTPFQSGCWLSAWYASLGQRKGVTPWPIEFRDRRSKEIVAALPLILRRRDGLRVAEFADLSVTDYNGPVFASSAPGDLRWLPTIIDAIGETPMPCDVLHLSKIRLSAAQASSLPCIGKCDLHANTVRIEGPWESYRRGTLKKKFRREMERSLRVFHRDSGSGRFQRITDLNQAWGVLEQMETIQQKRMESLGQTFLLNGPGFREFYRELLSQGLADGSVLLTALLDGNADTVSAMMGIRHDRHYAMIRMAQDAEFWSRCSPGKLIILTTMEYLHGEGITEFDFTTGDYPYKQGFAVEQEPLYEVQLGISLRGRVALKRRQALDRVKARMRHTALYKTAKNLMANSKTDP
ncbi:MAG: GNAT family N-acetyltransferase [Planctomycetota bacterium]